MKSTPKLSPPPIIEFCRHKSIPNLWQSIARFLNFICIAIKSTFQNHHFKKHHVSISLPLQMRRISANQSKSDINLRICINCSRQLLRIYFGCRDISLLIFNKLRFSIFVRRPSRRIALLVYTARP